jgi:hypothetical protein
LTKLDYDRSLRAKVVKLDLPRPPEFDLATDEQISENYNGIGSDKYHSLLWLTTKIFEVFEAAAMVHDFSWSPLWCDGSRERFEKANNRFRAGNLILACTCGVWFGWFRPWQRVLYRQSGELLYRVVESGIGWDIWSKAKRMDVDLGPEAQA